MKPRRERDPPGHRTTNRRHRVSHPEQALKPPTVESHHDLLPYDDHGHRHPAGLRDQLLSCRGILSDVLGGELYPVRRKKLFRRMTRLSGRGPVDRHLSFRHFVTHLEGLRKSVGQALTPPP